MRSSYETGFSMAMLLRVAAALNGLVVLASTIVTLTTLPFDNPVIHGLLFLHLIGLAACALALAARPMLAGLSAIAHAIFGVGVAFAVGYYGGLTLVISWLFSEAMETEDIVLWVSLYSILAACQAGMVVLCGVGVIVLDREDELTKTAPADDRGRVGERWL
ncbi:MAG: hypothetical protein AAF750_14425 [Planctomycetota bacterium]